jgi:hypothetical protein
MAYDFQPDATTALFFRPKGHAPYVNQRLWVMWPVYAYRVIAPLPSSITNLNIFQKAVLGFCRIGEIRADVIGKNLHLEPDLVQYVLLELRRKDLLDRDYLPTLEALRILKNEYDDVPSEILTGYVFQDPWAKLLWPRVVDKLQFAPTEFTGIDIFPTLIFGSAGKPRRYRPFVKRANFIVSPSTPTVQEILDASYRHQRDLKRISQSSEIANPVGEGIEDNTSADISRPNLQKVSLIGEVPECYYLVTFLYCTAKDQDPEEWYACDPFGLGASSNMRRWIEELSQKDDLLRDRLQEWLQKNQSNVGSRPEQLSQDDIVRAEIEARFSTLAELMPYYPQFVALVRSEIEVRETERPPRDKLNDVLIKAGIALEAVLDHVRTRHPSQGSTKIYSTADRQYRHELLNDVAGQLGFTMPVPRSLAAIDPKRVQRAEKSGGTLGERLTAALLAARSHPTHPFRQAALQMPDMLSKISELMYVRGQGAHFTDYTPSRQEIREFVNETIEIAKLLSMTEVIQPGDSNE